MGFGIIRLCAYCFAKFGNRTLVVINLREHQTDIVVSFGVVRTKAYSFAEFSQHLIAVCAFASQQKSEHIVGVGPAGIFFDQFVQPGDGRIPVRRWRRLTEVKSGFELTDRFVEFTQAEKNDAEINISCSRGRQKRNCAFQIQPRCLQIAGFSLSKRQERITGSRSGIKLDAGLEFRNRFLFRSFVPKSRAEIVVSLSGVWLQRNGALQMPDSGIEVALLTQNVSKQTVSISIVVIVLSTCS